MDSPPTLAECSRAVTRAALARRQRAKSEPTTQHLTAAALEERIVGLPFPPRPGRDGWWLVGQVLDDLDADGMEFDVWYRPEQDAVPRLGICRRELAPLPDPPAPRKRYFCGLRLAWIESS